MIASEHPHWLRTVCRTSVVAIPRHALAAILFVSALLIAAPVAPDSAGASAETKEQQAEISVTAEAGKWRPVRLPVLSRGTVIDVTIISSGMIDVAMLSELEAANYPATDTALFSGHTENHMAFSVTAPATGRYLLFLDNRTGETSRQLQISIRTGRNLNTTQDHLPPGLTERLEKITGAVKRIFPTGPLNIRAARCGFANAFSRNREIILCTELAQHLIADIGDARRATDTLLFVLLHELGHALLRDWGHPRHDNETVADEFAVALMVMFGQGERARAPAEYFESRAAAEGIDQATAADDPHPPSVRRARNILKWLSKDPNIFTRKWQAKLVPHMQTAFLQQLSQASAPWIDADAVRRELNKRDR